MELHVTIPPIIQFVASAVLAWFLADDLAFLPFKAPLLVRLLTVFAGIVFLSFALFQFYKIKTTINPLTPAKTSALVTNGIYGITRNPMYVGMAFLLLAWCLHLGEPIALISVPVFITTMNFFQIKAEESALTRLFGDDYRRYQDSVSRWLFV